MSGTILTCDDHPHITRLVELTFRQADCDVIICSNGRSAWETLLQVTPDLIISDYDMPGINGVDLCRMIRSHSVLKEVPVILLTARGLNLPTDELMGELDISDVITKPFSPRLLRESGLELIDKSRITK